MRVTLILSQEQENVQGETIEEILEKSGYTIESIILLKKGKVILEEEVSDQDTVEVMPVASGG
ncbi:MAG: MoaD/ThiS family protein [Theionarchaea archaeon]|nr:MAG: hypothetical protein AYK18_03395 [Theionarchaea archaeon DG-70]MBU7010129.1 MoaD/ThiS family protein [Theionarchaea archaeon]